MTMDDTNRPFEIIGDYIYFDGAKPPSENIHCSDQSGSLLGKCATDRMADEISDYLTYGMHHSTQEAKSRISEIIRGENE